MRWMKIVAENFSKLVECMPCSADRTVVRSCAQPRKQVSVDLRVVLQWRHLVYCLLDSLVNGSVMDYTVSASAWNTYRYITN